MSYTYGERTQADGSRVAQVACDHGTTARLLTVSEVAGIEALTGLVSRHVAVHGCSCAAAVGQQMARAAAGGGSRR